MGVVLLTSIRDVARLAEVSPATVSRVINGTANVDDEKKQRVLKVIKETGFVPNEVARSLFKRSAKIIGLIVPSIDNPFFTQMASAIEKEADEHGFRLLLCNTGHNPEKEKSMIQMLMSMNADGIIVTTSNEEIMPLIESSQIPIVTTDRRPLHGTNCSYIHCNHYDGGRLAMQHLMDCGCKNVVCIKGPQDISSAKERYEGYRDVCNDNGITEMTVCCDYEFNEGLAVTEELLEKYPHTDGIIACNDMVAVSVYKVLHNKGIEVPDKIQIIGFDDIAMASLMTPELTTIAQPITEMGVKAARLITDCNKKNEEYIFPAQLIKRETTKYS